MLPCIEVFDSIASNSANLASKSNLKSALGDVLLKQFLPQNSADFLFEFAIPNNAGWGFGTRSDAMGLISTSTCVLFKHHQSQKSLARADRCGEIILGVWLPGTRLFPG